MIYDRTLNSVRGPYEIEVRHYEDGSVELWLPQMATPITIKNNAVRIELRVPGLPIPIELTANWVKAPTID